MPNIVVQSAGPTSKLIRFRFPHGLGDVANFAHSIPLWTRRGIQVQVNCTPDKQCMFEAAGAEIVGDAGAAHGYYHPPAPGSPEMEDSWSGNKIAWNLTAGPMPRIGGWSDLWPELCGVKLSLRKYLTDQSRSEIDDWLKRIDGPLIVLHTRGNTGPGAKNLAAETEADLYRQLLDRTNGTLLLLDYDERVQRLNSRRCLHLTDDWRKLTVPELAYLFDRSALFIGVDSGPLHLTRFSSVPALGLWLDHHPAHFALPRDQTAHIVLASPRHRAWTRNRRHSFNLLDHNDPHKHSGEFIARQAARVLDGKVGRDLVGMQLLDSLNQSGPAADVYQDRHVTFRRVLDHLRTKASPRMLETGTIRSEDDWTAGFSSYVFGHFLAGHGSGHLDSVDLDGTNVAFARRWTAPFRDHVTVHLSDSIAWLSRYSGPKFDLAYLDSADVGTAHYEGICLKEAQLVLPHLNEDGLVLVDDTYWRRGRWFGKGSTAIPWLEGQGMRVQYSGYQTLLSRC